MDPTLVVAEAERWLGTPYRHQGSRIGVGCDCLGLVRGVWLGLHGFDAETPPPYQPDWAEATGEERLLDASRRWLVEDAAGEVAAGQVLLFRWRAHLPAKHAAIAISADRLIHAYEGQAVTVSSLVPQWRRRIAGVFSFPANSRSD